MNDIDIYKNSSVIMLKKVPVKIISLITILLVFLIFILVFGIFFTYNKYEKCIGIVRGNNIVLELSPDKINKIKDRLYIDNKKYNLVTVGRICHQKGFDILIEHMENIVQQNKNVNLYIIGDGPDAPKIKKLVKRKKLQENVFFLGSQKNPFEYMKKMDAFVITSRYEGQGMVILEAKVIGLPIFIPKHLEKYVEGIEGCINIEKDILGAKKIEDKQVDYLNKYNYNIKEKIARLLS